jgi:glycosyltransferase involved in cell wall biosynthesis
MRVLMVTQLLPYPLDNGSRIRNYYLVRHLSQRHRVTLVSFVREAGEEAFAGELRPFCEAVHTVRVRRSHLRDPWHFARSLATREPFLVARDWSRAMARLLQRLQQDHSFDVVHVWPVTMAPYALAMSGIRRVVDCDDVKATLVARMAKEMPWWMRGLARLEARGFSRYEPHVVGRVDRALVVSEVDRRCLEDLGAPPERLSVVPIGVETDIPGIRRESEAPPAILHVGSLHYLPNREGLRWFLREIFPRVEEWLPRCRLYIVGAEPPPDLWDWARNNSRIVVVGHAPELQPYLEKACLLAVPLRSGSGMRVKILEAFARGIPVVTTTMGYEGIEATPGEHLLAADDAAGFAASVVRLATDGLLARRLTGNARRLVKEKYDWRRVGEALDVAYDSAA